MKEFKLENEPQITSGFTIPEDYFDVFSAKMMLELPVNEKPKIISIFRDKKRILMMVAAVLVVGLLVPALYTFSINTKKADQKLLENYISYQSNINQYDLINELELEDINKIESAIALEDETIEEVLITNSNLEQLIIE